MADVDVTSPSSGKSYKASGGSASVEIKWKDDSEDGDTLYLGNVEGYTISLCYMDSDDISCPQTVVKDKKFDSNKYTAKIDASDVPNGYYFFQIYTTFEKDSTSIHYTDSFKLSGMSGPSASIKATSSVAAPDPQISLGEAATSINSASFSLTYTKQTGRTKFAPMQMQPKTTVTHSKWSRRFPSSSYTPYSTLRKSPNCKTTITPGWSYTPKSATNTVSPAGYPTSFYAASSRVSKPTLSSASKSKRWL
ncbi:hypothetical protein QCA50_019058 [Cerrena zonata]|uniref:Uncharacterized protein n=1 Tax=Cerrena zonata TaxID=2478898 RepID=A0AAW0FC92_9APHY